MKIKLRAIQPAQEIGDFGHGFAVERAFELREQRLMVSSYFTGDGAPVADGSTDMGKHPFKVSGELLGGEPFGQCRNFKMNQRFRPAQLF